MIKINLLPEDLKKQESSFTRIALSFKGREGAVKNFVIALILILVAVHVALFFIGTRSSATLKSLTQKHNSLIPGMKECEALKVETDITNRKAQSIDSLMANRFSWAMKLNSLSDCMTPGIWLTSLSYEAKPGEVSVQVKIPSSPAGGKKETMKTETKNVNLRYLNISGYASGTGEQMTVLIGNFIKSMKESESFFRDFSEIKLESIKSEKFLDQEVMSFKITCLFKT